MLEYSSSPSASSLERNFSATFGKTGPVITSLDLPAAAVIGGLCWMAALSRLSLSTAYPFVALMIAAVMLANAVVISEPLRLLHFAGIVLIGLGLLAIAQT